MNGFTPEVWRRLRRTVRIEDVRAGFLSTTPHRQALLADEWRNREDLARLRRATDESRDHWKKQDRPHAPCANCGEELYDQFWGNGGWAPVEKATDELHSERRCIARLKAALDAQRKDGRDG